MVQFTNSNRKMGTRDHFKSEAKPKKQVAWKCLLSLSVIFFCSNVFAQNFEGTYTASDFSIVLISRGSNGYGGYDGEITYKGKKQIIKGGYITKSNGSYQINVTNDLNKGQVAFLTQLSNGNLIWSNKYFLNMPKELMLQKSGGSNTTAQPTNSQTQSQTNSVNVNGNNNTTIIQNNNTIIQR